MKGTDNFKSLIQQHLKHAAGLNSLFAEKLKNPKKNIDDCIKYILGQVQQSGMNGFEDTEIYGMAMHYYDEENIKPGDIPTSGQVIVNHHKELSEEEIKSIKKEAKERLIKEEMARLKKKKTPEKNNQKKKEESKTLFENG